MPGSLCKYKGIWLYPCINYRAIRYCPVVATGHFLLQGYKTVQSTHCALEAVYGYNRCSPRLEWTYTTSPSSGSQRCLPAPLEKQTRTWRQWSSKPQLLPPINITNKITNICSNHLMAGIWACRLKGFAAIWAPWTSPSSSAASLPWWSWSLSWLFSLMISMMRLLPYRQWPHLSISGQLLSLELTRPLLWTILWTWKHFSWDYHL